MIEDQRTFREKMLAKAAEFIHKKVPAHSRAQYEALLVTNTDLALELISKWRDLEDLKAAYRDLQYETAKRTAPLPPLISYAEVNHLPYERGITTSVRWKIDPYQMTFAVSDENQLRSATTSIRNAFERYFHDRYVPELWASTERTLWPVLMNGQDQ